MYETILEALFPLSETEKELFSCRPCDISSILPPSPNYSGLAVPLPEGTSLFAYKDTRVEQLIWNIKYKKSRQAVEIGGYELFGKLCEINMVAPASDFQDTPSKPAGFAAGSQSPTLLPKRPSNSEAGATRLLIIPIPITKLRRRERGYNQCELLVDEVERLDKEAKFISENNLLIRMHHDGRHTLKGRTDRVESAKGIFGVDESTLKKLTEKYGADKIKNCKVVIIDDVITTGSTMREAIDTMKKSGFTNVSGLSVAH
ncbi:MAG TPA: phosphoribosyltransferase family protein [Candidatus Paceibacterota bacterium]|jgi:hypothetical protein|nr:phosphoribosyltransferase family protein [Candidatus Paceibacterota bacterium]